MSNQQIVVEKDGLHVVLDPVPTHKVLEPSPAKNTNVNARYATRIGTKGNTYYVDSSGFPIPSLRMQDKVWYSDEYSPYNVNDLPEKNSKRLWTLKWAWVDRPRVTKWLCPPRIEPWFNKPDSFGISGVRGGGKSALLVAILSSYHARGGSIIDSYQSNDNESLCWLTSPWKKNVVLLHGEGVEFKFSKDVYGTMDAKSLDARHLPSGKIFIITKMGFGSEVLYYDFLNNLTEQATHRDSWNIKKIDVWGIREAQEFVGSKMRSSQASNAKNAQDAFVRFHTQALHGGWAIVYDRPRYTGADKDIRELTTWQLFKAQGAQDWPRQLNWYFKFLTPRLLRHMPRNMALMAGENGGLGIMNFGFPFWLWNTKQGFSITEKVGISTVYDAEKIRELVSAVMQDSAASGHKKIMTDEMHEEVVRLHIGDGSVEDPTGMSLKDLAITKHVSLPTISKAWRTHALQECGCNILTQEINSKALMSTTSES